MHEGGYMTIVLDNQKKGSVSEYLKTNIENNSKIDVISPLFTIYAYEELSETLKKVKSMRFLFNAPAFINRMESNQKEVKEFHLEIKNRERQLSELSYEISLKNNLDQNQVASKCYDFVREKAEVRSVITNNTLNTSNFFVKNNSSPFLIGGDKVAFSMEGLGYSSRTSFNFNTVISDLTSLNHFEELFNSVWFDVQLTENVKEKFLDHILNLYKENTPQLVFYLTLYHLFSERMNTMDDLAQIKERTGINNTKIWSMLYSFQHDAVVGAIKKLELYNGCIIADSVGLGKTFEALAVIKYYELRNYRVIVLSPKKLRSNWVGFKQNSTLNPLVNDRFAYDVLFHTDLSRNNGYSGEIDLSKINWGNYDLLVIDESHNFRNRRSVVGKTTRYEKLMNDIIKSGVKTKVLMLSATPVNNGLTDLKNQIMIFAEDNDEAFKENVGINSIDVTLRNAQTRINEWSESPKHLQTTEALLKSLDYNFYNLLNTTTIARSRKHIQKYYDMTEIGEFPTRLKPISIKSSIDMKGRFPDLVDVNNQILQLHLSIYSPILYVLPTKIEEYESKYEQIVKGGKSRFKQSDRDRNLVNLMRVNILKRLESSVYSFALTLGRILDQISNVEDLIENHQDIVSDINTEDEDEEFESEYYEIGKTVRVKLKDMDLIRYKEDLLEDKVILEKLLDYSRMIKASDDAKLADLKRQIVSKITEPINGTNRKILIFTAFSDTAEYLHDNLSNFLLSDYHVYSGIVTGSSLVKTNVPKAKNNFEDILMHFSPVSNQMTNLKNEIDVLIATDCISEGQNLQDCDYLINYDIHWNPVRIIQRFGRIDRIGSKNKVIQLVNFWPNMELDEYINLETRVRNRMTVVDLSATGEDDLLNPISKDLDYRNDQLKQLQNEVMDLEDLTGGLSLTDLTLDDLILSLEKFIKANPKLLEGYPTGIHAVATLPEKLIEELTSGVIFCLRQVKYSENEKSLGTLYPYYLVYVKEDGSILIDNANPKKILDVYKAICSDQDSVDRQLVATFNRKTQNGNDMSFYTELLDNAIYDIKGYVEDKGVKSLFRLGKSTILDNKASGLDDFELVSFLVVK